MKAVQIRILLRFWMFSNPHSKNLKTLSKNLEDLINIVDNS